MINRIDDTCGNDTLALICGYGHAYYIATLICFTECSTIKRETTTPRTPSSLLYIALPIWFLPSTCTGHISNVDNDESLMRYTLYGTDVFCFVVTAFLNENIITGTCAHWLIIQFTIFIIDVTDEKKNNQISSVRQMRTT